MEWKIYTKTGDKGETSLIGGTRVPKYDDRIEAYGTLDELNSYLGLLRDKVTEPILRDLLIQIQRSIFTAESWLAADSKESAAKLPALNEHVILAMEKQIDRMEERLPALENFVLPGGNEPSSVSHIARCVCRRCERLVIKVVDQYDTVPDPGTIIRLLNRLSDFLFVLARHLLYKDHGTEIIWKPES